MPEGTETTAAERAAELIESGDAKNIYYLRDAPPARALLALGLPMAAGLAITSVYNLVNSYFVGHYGTVEDLAALIYGYPIIGVITAIAGMFGVGASTLTARLLGEGSHHKIASVTSFALHASLAAGVLLAAVGLLFAHPITVMMGASAAAYQPTYWFIVLLLAGAPPWMCMFTLEQLVRAEGYAKQSMYGLAWGVVANLVLDALLIGAFDMGAAGSGWALMGANIASAVYYLVFLRAKSKNFSWNPRHIRLNTDILKPVFVIGSSELVSSLFIVFSTLVLNNLAVKYGDDVVASFGVSIRLIMVPETLCMGICMGGIPLFAYAYGARDRARLTAALKAAVLFAVGTSAVFSLPAWFFRDWALYLTGGPALVNIGDKVLTALLCSTVFYALVVLWISWLQACNKGTAAIIMTASVGVFFFVCVLAGDALFGFDGLTWAFPVSMGAACTVGAVLFFITGGTAVPEPPPVRETDRPAGHGVAS